MVPQQKEKAMERLQRIVTLTTLLVLVVMAGISNAGLLDNGGFVLRGGLGYNLYKDPVADTVNAIRPGAALIGVDVGYGGDHLEFTLGVRFTNRDWNNARFQYTYDQLRLDIAYRVWQPRLASPRWNFEVYGGPFAGRLHFEDSVITETRLGYLEVPVNDSAFLLGVSAGCRVTFGTTRWGGFLGIDGSYHFPGGPIATVDPSNLNHLTPTAGFYFRPGRK
jgi:hypothetical protein